MKFLCSSFFTFFLLMSVSVSTYAQNLNDNNQSERLSIRRSCNFVNGEVIVKFNDASGVNIKRSIKGRYLTSQVKKVDAVLSDTLGVFDVEDLMPLTGRKIYPRKVRQADGSMRGDRDMSRLCLIHYDTTQVENVDMAITALERLDAVEYAEPNYLVYPADLPDAYSDPIISSRKKLKESEDEPDSTDYAAIYTQEPLYSQQWGPAAVNLPWLWQQPIIHKKRPVIAIIDSGVELDHPDLQDNIWDNELEVNGIGGQDDDQNGYFDDIHGYDFIYKTGVITDRLSHGTFCAGIAAASGTNGLGITGANPNALIMPLVVLDKSNSGTYAHVIQAIDYATANGADILSMSIGGNCYSQAQEEALWKAFIAGKYLVASAGNDNKDIYTKDPMCDRFHMFPAAFKFVLGVEGSEVDGSKVWFSNFDSDGPIFSEYDPEGPAFFGDYYNYELRAPASTIMSTYLHGTYSDGGGTSFSTPLIAGGLSRLLQCRDYSSQENLAGILIQTRDSITTNVDFKAAYEIDELAVDPALVVTHYTILDTIAGSNGDGRINPGEIIEIYPTIRCLYGQANGISVSINQGLNVDTTTLTVLKNKAKVGMNLSPGATIKCKEPIIAKVAERCGDGYTIQLYPTIEVDSTETINMASAYAHRLILEIEDRIYLNGVFNQDTILYPNKKYIVDKFVILGNGVHMTIMPGTKLQMRKGAAFSIGAGSLTAVGKPDSMIVFSAEGGEKNEIRYFDFNHNDTIQYAKFVGLSAYGGELGAPIKNAILKNCEITGCYTASGNWKKILSNTHLFNCNFVGNKTTEGHLFFENSEAYHTNFINNTDDRTDGLGAIFRTADNEALHAHACNIFNNYNANGEQINVCSEGSAYFKYIMDQPCYFGSAVEDEVREGIWDIYKGVSLIEFDLTNKLNYPDSSAHGIVARVRIDNEEINKNYWSHIPIGVGTHTFDVVYNRPMDISENPVVSFGVREPFTQHVVSNNAHWSSDSTTYSADITITGRTLTDGVNTMLITGGRDNELFPVVVDSARFNFLIQAAGSLSTGLAAQPGLGKVTLTWRTDEEDFDDLMGYDIYRWTDDTIFYDGHWSDDQSTWIESGWKIDSVIVNDYLLEKGSTQYVDYNVVPGKTYYYVIQQVTSALKGVPMSNPVSATPLTATKGDSNGSMSVNVADVLTTVAYIMHETPQPFIFEAADVNNDSTINIFDVVGTVNLILNPQGVSTASINSPAFYSIEDGILYVETDAVLGGVQVILTADTQCDIEALDALDGFERAGQWQNENQYLFMAYSMSKKTIEPGKHALLRIGDAELESIVLSDPLGKEIAVMRKTPTSVTTVETMQISTAYPNPFTTELTIPYVIGENGKQRAEVVVTDVTGRTIDRMSVSASYGAHTLTWKPLILNSGIYFINLYVDDVLIQTEKVVKK